MPTERIEVQVVCTGCGGTGKTPQYAGGKFLRDWPCEVCSETRKQTATLAPDSLAAALMELGRAAMAYIDETGPLARSDAAIRYVNAVHTVRRHPDYKAGTNG